MKRRSPITVVLALLALGAVGGLFVSVGGLAPIKASSGHFAITEWVLQLTMRRSVATQSITVPELAPEEPWLALKGAGHYESGCRPCHGSPGQPPPAVAQAMLPPPPPLSTHVGRWDPEELFFIVKHGIKFTGMPGWPSQVRDDEVRAMVAFLRVMPKLDAAQYHRWVHGEAAPDPAVAPLHDLLEPRPHAPDLADRCARCHGRDGCGRELAAFPRLAGQRAAYLRGALRAYARGERHSGMMQPIAVALRDDELHALALHYAALPGCPPLASEPLAVARGATIVREGIPARRVPACGHCHGPSAHAQNPAYPRLAGQYADYLVLQLELWKAGLRGGSEYHPLMHEVVDHLDHAAMRDVAAYYASLSASR